MSLNLLPRGYDNWKLRGPAEPAEDNYSDDDYDREKDDLDRDKDDAMREEAEELRRELARDDAEGREA